VRCNRFYLLLNDSFIFPLVLHLSLGSIERMKTTETGKNENKLLSNEDKIVSMLNIFKLLFKRRVVGQQGDLHHLQNGSFYLRKTVPTGKNIYLNRLSHLFFKNLFFLIFSTFLSFFISFSKSVTFFSYFGALRFSVAIAQLHTIHYT
jgi:hypothetical protein